MGQIINRDSLLLESKRFPVNTTYGNDLILPKVLENRRIASALVDKIVQCLSQNNYRIPKDFLIGRLVLLSKNNSPLAVVDKTRPIAIQSLPIRLIEKVIITKLRNCRI